MRKLILLSALAIFTAPVFGQSAKVSDTATAEFLDPKFWSSLGKPTEGSRGFSLFTRNMQPKSDSLFEVWIKIMPNNAAAFNRRYGLPRESAYVLQFATVDCERRTVMMEKTAAFDGMNGSVDARASDLVKGESRSRVRSGSVSESVFEYLCLKLE